MMRHALATLALLLATPLAGQEVRLEVGWLNAGELVAEVEKRLRLGNHSWAHYAAIELAEGSWRMRLMASPSHIYIWPADSHVSRWASQPDSARSEPITWACASAGIAHDMLYAEASAMPSVCGFVGADASFWGASVGPAIGLRFAFRLEVWAFGISASLSPLYVSPSRWTVLRKVGALEDASKHPWDAPRPVFIWPVAVGISAGVGR